jgi:adenylate cyclase
VPKKKFGLLDHTVQVFGIGVIGAVIAFLLWGTGVLDTWELKTWDWRVRLLARDGDATDRIRLILVDQNSLDWGSKENGWPWPWPREIYGVILDHCLRMGAKAVALDILFTEPSAYGAGDDAALGRAIAETEQVAGTLFLGHQTGSATIWPEEYSRPESDIRLDADLSGKAVERLRFPRAAFPIPEVAESAALLCNVHLQPDSDGIYRRVRPVSVFDGQILPSLGMGLYLIDRPATGSTLSDHLLQAGDRQVPLDEDGEALLRFRGPAGTHRAYSAAAVLQSELRIRSGESPAIDDPDAFRGKYVLVGFSAPGLFDLRPTPMGGVFSGVEIHATFLDNLLSGDFIHRVPGWITLSATLLISLVCAASLAMLSGPAALAGAGLGFLLIPVSASVGAYAVGFRLPLVVIESALVLVIFFNFAAKYAVEGRQKRFIKNAFRQYLSPAVIEQILEDPDRLQLGGKRRTLSIFFSDLESFTSISEGLEPEDLSALLNEYLTAMTDIIIEEGGTVDKYEGDAIIAFWNAPLEDPDHAFKCVRAALRCQERLAQMRPGFSVRLNREVRMRIGINTGDASVGNFGSQTKFDYTAIGDAVNLAARLEGTNKAFGTYTMISRSTREAAGEDFLYREIARIAVKGKTEAVTVFEPMFPREYEACKAVFKAFATARETFYAGRFTAARDQFLKIADIDPASKAYVQKCDDLIRVPPADWCGVWVMHSK